MVDALAHLVIVEPIGAAGERHVVGAGVDRRAGIAQHARQQRFRYARHVVGVHRCRLIALTDHDPAHIFEHFAAVGLAAGRAHEHDAGLAAGVLLEADHLRDRADGVARIDRGQEPAGRIAKIGHRVDRDIRHGLAEHGVEHQEVINRGAWVADRLREGVRGLHRKARPVEPVVERDVAGRDGPRRGVPDQRPDAKVLEEVAGACFAACFAHRRIRSGGDHVAVWHPRGWRPDR